MLSEPYVELGLLDGPLLTLLAVSRT